MRINTYFKADKIEFHIQQITMSRIETRECGVEMAAGCDDLFPLRSTEGSAGFDLFAAHDARVEPDGKVVMVRTGVYLRTSRDTYARIAARSGLTYKQNLHVGAGVIDSDYTGEIGVLLYCTAGDGVTISRGDRIAQMIIERCWTLPMQKLSPGEVSGSVVKHAGFGSTG